MILPIVAVALLLPGGVYLISHLQARRDVRRMRTISEHLMDGDRDGAKELAHRWEDLVLPWNAVSA